MALSLWPPLMSVTAPLGGPMRGCVTASSPSQYASSAARTFAILKMAFTPSRGVDEWAERPRTRIRGRRLPRCAMPTRSRVGSPMIA
jgi:hypothetical protein